MSKLLPIGDGNSDIGFPYNPFPFPTTGRWYSDRNLVVVSATLTPRITIPPAHISASSSLQGTDPSDLWKSNSDADSRGWSSEKRDNAGHTEYFDYKFADFQLINRIELYPVLDHHGQTVCFPNPASLSILYGDEHGVLQYIGHFAINNAKTASVVYLDKCVLTRQLRIAAIALVADPSGQYYFKLASAATQMFYWQIGQEEATKLKQYVAAFPDRPIIFEDEPMDSFWTYADAPFSGQWRNSEPLPLPASSTISMSSYAYSYGQLVELLAPLTSGDPNVVPGGFFDVCDEKVAPGIQQFISSYNELFGRNPPVKYWNFHQTLYIAHFDDWQKSISRCRDWSIGKTVDCPGGPIGSAGPLPADLRAPIIVGSFWIRNYDPNLDGIAAELMRQATEFLSADRDIVAAGYYGYHYSYWEDNVFPLTNSDESLTRVGKQFLYPLTQWVAFDYLGRPSGAIMDVYGKFQRWDGDRWISGGVTDAVQIYGSQAYQPGLSFGVRVRQGDDYFAGWNGNQYIKFPAGTKDGWVAFYYQGQKSWAVLDQTGNLSYWSGSLWEPMSSATDGQLLGKRYHQPGLTFVLRFDGDYFLGWDGAQPQRLGGATPIPASPFPSSMKAWVAFDYFGQPSVAVLTGLISNPYLHRWEGNSWSINSPITDAAELFGSQTYQPGLTFVARVRQGGDYFVGWDGNQFIKLGGDTTPSAAVSYRAYSYNALQSVQVKTRDGQYVWTGRTWLLVNN